MKGYPLAQTRIATQEAVLARAVAGEMDLPKERAEGIHVAGRLHDIGKVYVPIKLLNKPRKLTEVEMNLVKMHSRVAYDILENVESPWPVARIVFQHHERMDGSGYPDGLTGRDILLEARILAVADVVEAMSSHRPYREAFGIDAARAGITQKKGVLYDAEVDACIRVFEKDFRFG